MTVVAIFGNIFVDIFNWQAGPDGQTLNVGRRDIRNNDTLQNDIQHNGTLQNDAQYNRSIFQVLLLGRLWP
jgi:hypothetical protein